MTWDPEEDLPDFAIGFLKVGSFLFGLASTASLVGIVQILFSWWGITLGFWSTLGYLFMWEVLSTSSHTSTHLWMVKELYTKEFSRTHAVLSLFVTRGVRWAFLLGIWIFLKVRF